MVQFVLARLAAVLVLSLLPFGGAAQGTVSLKTDQAEPRLALPEPGKAQMRSLSQLMWDPVGRTLTRQRIEILDLFPDAGLSLTWQPRADALGRLIWRRPGAASYDMTQVVALYDGGIKDGRPHGQGMLWLRSGAGYRGGWQEGLMSGQGHLRWPDGGEYAGSFVRGLPDGDGRLTDPGGTVHIGNFVAGLRHGPHRVLPPDARGYRSIWANGQEVSGGRSPIPGPGGIAHMVQVQQLQHDDASLGIAVNRTLPPGISPGGMMLYDSYSEGSVLHVYPGGEGFMDRWRGRQPLWVSSSIWGGAHDFFDGNHQPASFDMSLENSGTQPLHVVGGYLYVRESVPDLEPALEVEMVSDVCPMPPIYTGFRFKNYGWSHPIDAQITGAFMRPAGGPASPDFVLGSDGSGWPQQDFDFAFGLRQVGVDIARLSEYQNCPSGDYNGCTEALIRSGAFGQVAEAIYVSTDDSGDVYIGADFVGSLNYVWRDATGAAHRKSSPLRLPVRLTSFGAILTCAEGGDEIFNYPNPFVLQANAQNYSLPFPINAVVAPGMISRWSFQIDATMASRHFFQIVLQLADGREVASRPVDLTYFKQADIWAN